MFTSSKILIATLVGTVGGIITSLVFNTYSSMHIVGDVSFQINPLDIFSISANIFLAIYISQTLSRRNDQEKSEKELAISYLKEFQVEFNRKINELLECDNLNSSITVPCFRTLRTRINSLLSLAKENNFISEKDETAEGLLNKFSEIWDLISNMIITSDSTGEKEQINIFKQVEKIEHASIDLDKLVFLLIMKINRK